MIFSSKPGHRRRRALAGVLSLAMLAACGGGTSQYEVFIPERLIVFGDETSALTPTGLKYSVNGTATTDNGDGTTSTSIACGALPTWVQSLAGFYGFVFAECNPTNFEQTNAKMYAQAGARVEDIAVQVSAHVAAGGFRGRDLATVLAGANDIVELYQQFPARTEEDLSNELRERGRRLAAQVNALISQGARVIVSNVPDMGLTPYAFKQRAEFDDTDRAALLSRLTAAFNEQLGVNILLDGRYVGLVQADVRTQAMARAPDAFGLANVTSAVCLEDTVLDQCSTETLVTDGSAGSWMWADDLRPAYSVQVQIASLAIDRARRNPF